MSVPVLEARSVAKRFGGVVALREVSFELATGEVHALCGENGAGKSTLIKLLAGIHPHGSYDGQILVNGTEARFASARAAEEAGIAVIHQELALFPDLTIAENLLLSRLPTRRGLVDQPRMLALARALLDEVGLAVDPALPLRELGVAQQQLVEIARALARRPRILVLDEPTAALARHEIDSLLALVSRLRGQGVACIYISHKLDEVFAIADRITVLRDGQAQGTHVATRTDAASIIAMMVGRPLGELYPRRRRARGAPVLEVNGLEVRCGSGRVAVLRNIDLTVHAGEVLGIGGLMGAGRSELLLHLMGLQGERRNGHVKVGGHLLAPGNPRLAMRAGLALVTEDRKRLGLVPDAGVAFNLMLSSLARVSRRGLLDESREARLAGDMCAELRVKASSLETAVGALSGGNQQKVVIGKALLTQPRVLLLDEPTRGIDVGAKLEVYELINRLTEAGQAIVLVSSELPELLGISDRIVMLHEGRIGGEFDPCTATQQQLLGAAMGMDPGKAA
jgi:D-xylose transport system ATP-binding protein